MSTKDDIYSQPLDTITGFTFDEHVVNVFPDMIQRSVPGYSTIIAMTGVLAERYVQPNSRCYDLGSSLGASTLAMRRQLHSRPCKIIAVDNSVAMQNRCREILAQDNEGNASPVDVELVDSDIRDITIANASVVVLNFTLQFIANDKREALLKRIFDGMLDGGILILSEKILFEDPHLQALNTDLHHSFKRANGYSEMEVSQKRTALENVLIPETIASHQHRLKAVGFNNVDVWFQCFNFASLVAIK
jgi:tRNA (cmo5U34)-methyltransferase|tara:strand:- start:865 stop:1605 length:741 start_codon:yes stop_codon:yes gene_type:complete